MTNNHDFIDSISESDCSVIEVDLQNHPFLSSYAAMLDHSKANFEKMKAFFKEEFTSIDNCMDVESQNAIFDSTPTQAKKHFIPKKVLKPNLLNHHGKLNRTIRAKLDEKQRLWKRYLNTQDNNVFYSINLQFVEFVERDSSNQVKGDLEAFWKYVNNKKEVQSQDSKSLQIL